MNHTQTPPAGQSLVCGRASISWTARPDSVSTVTLRDVLDSAGSDGLDRIVAGLVNKGCGSIALDVEHLDRMTTAGAGALIKIATDRKHSGHELVIICPNPEILGLLRILGLEREVRIFQDAAHANAALGV